MTNGARRPRQFRLAAIFLAMIAASVPLSWIACQQREARARAAVEHRINQRGGSVVTGVDGQVTVDFDHQPVRDQDLKLLLELPRVDEAFLGGTQLTDDGLATLASLPNLRWLDLRDTAVSDAGLERLRGMRQLQLLRVERSQVTPAGLERLRRAIPELRTDLDAPSQ